MCVHGNITGSGYIAAHVGPCAVLQYVDDEAAAHANTAAGCCCIGSDIALDGVVRLDAKVIDKCQGAVLGGSGIGFHVNTGNVQCQNRDNRVAACGACFCDHGLGAGELSADIHAAQEFLFRCHAEYYGIFDGCKYINTGNTHSDACTNAGALAAGTLGRIGVTQRICNCGNCAGINGGIQNEIRFLVQDNFAFAGDPGSVGAVHNMNCHCACQANLFCGSKSCPGNHAGVHILGLGSNFESTYLHVGVGNRCIVFIADNAYAHANTQSGIGIARCFFVTGNGGTICQGFYSHGTICMDAKGIGCGNAAGSCDICVVTGICVSNCQRTNHLTGAGSAAGTVGSAGSAAVHHIGNALAVGFAFGILAGELVRQLIKCIDLLGVLSLGLFLAGFLGIAVFGSIAIFFLGSSAGITGCIAAFGLAFLTGILHLIQQAVFTGQLINEIRQCHGVAIVARGGSCIVDNVESCPGFHVQSLACQNHCLVPDSGKDFLVHNGNRKEAAGLTNFTLADVTAGGVAQLDSAVCIDKYVATGREHAAAGDIHICPVVHNRSGEGEGQFAGIGFGSQTDPGVRGQIDAADIGIDDSAVTNCDTCFADNNTHCQRQAVACQSGIAGVGVNLGACENAYCAGKDLAKDIGNGAADLNCYKVQIGCCIVIFQRLGLFILSQLIETGNQTFQSGEHALILYAGYCDFHSLGCGDNCVFGNGDDRITDNIKERSGNLQIVLLVCQVVFQDAEAVAVRILKIQQNAVCLNGAVHRNAACAVQRAGLGTEKHIHIGCVDVLDHQIFAFENQVGQEERFIAILAIAAFIGIVNFVGTARYNVICKGLESNIRPGIFFFVVCHFHFPFPLQGVGHSIDVRQGDVHAGIELTDCGCA